MHSFAACASPSYMAMKWMIFMVVEMAPDDRSFSKASRTYIKVSALPIGRDGVGVAAVLRAPGREHSVFGAAHPSMKL